MKNVLEIHRLEKALGGKPIVKGLSLHVKAGEVVGLLGPNGAGKTTAFYMIVGLIAPDLGQVFFKGEEITAWPIHKRAKLGLGYLAQEPSIFRSLTVEENILCVLQMLKLPKQEEKIRLEKLLQELHIEHLRKKKAIALSGGERRRLEITRALITEPALLLLDEPFANIDPLAVSDVKHLISHLKQKGISVLITDHNAREIFSIVDRSYLLQDGKVLKEGTVDVLVSDPQARQAYFGEHFRV
jgi:lipopolysaccharide export system ATP-binding protein